MRQYTEKILTDEGWEIKNCKIEDANLLINSHGIFELNLTYVTHNYTGIYGGYCLGKAFIYDRDGYDDKFEPYEEGLEAIMRILAVVGVNSFIDLKGSYCRIAQNKRDGIHLIIGNILSDKWFDYVTFFEDKEREENIKKEAGIASSFN